LKQFLPLISQKYQNEGVNLCLFFSEGMPVLEDGLSDSENISDDDQSPSVKRRTNGRNQSTQSDLLLGLNLSSLKPSHKHQFTKSIPNECESQSQSFYIHPTSTNLNQHKSSTVPKGKFS
jgi:hypothetical protein